MLEQVTTDSFIKERGTGVCGLVTGKASFQAGKKTLPAFKVRLADGSESLILEQDAIVIAL